MMFTKRLALGVIATFSVLGMSGPAQAQAASYSGRVAWLEVWAYGNVSFRLEGVANTCAGTNGHTFVVNKSREGAKNIYAALLAAKLAGVQVSAWTSGCGAADGFSATTPYVLVDYLYLLN